MSHTIRALRLTLTAAALLVFSSSGSLAEQSPPRKGFVPSLSTVPLPGGVEGLRRAAGDREVMEPALVGLEFVRRFHNGTDEAAARNDRRARVLAWLQDCATDRDPCRAPGPGDDVVPLPGTPELWLRLLPPRSGGYGDRTLFPALLADRRASLIYVALLSMEEGTRQWALEHPDWLAGLTEAQAAVLTVAAPALQMVDGRVRLPGGEPAMPIWSALADAPVDPAPHFVSALIDGHRGMLAALLEAVSLLTPEQQAAALRLGADVPQRVDAGRRLLAATAAAAGPWHPAARPFSRPSLDVALLLWSIPLTPEGRLALPGGQRFWEAVFGGQQLHLDAATRRALTRTDVPLDPAWLAERVLSGGFTGALIRARQVLFASRCCVRIAPGRQFDLVIGLRGLALFPQLLPAVERVLPRPDPELLASLVRRAWILDRNGETWRGQAERAQWQAAIAILGRRATFVDAGTEEELEAVLQRLARVVTERAPRGDTLRAVLDWLEVDARAVDAGGRLVEDAVLARLTSPSPAAGRTVRWEEAEYRIDPGAAERQRMRHVRGRPVATLDGAAAVLALADAVETRPADAEAERALRARVERTLTAVRSARSPEPGDVFGARAMEASRSAAAYADGRGSLTKLREALYDLADALAAIAMMEITYAAGLGWAELLPVTADIAAGRHVFAMRATPPQPRDIAWLPPRIATDTPEPWHVAGSLLGLDVTLAPIALRRLSLRPPPAPPTLPDAARGVMAATAVLHDRRAFSDAAQARLVDLLRRGRERLSSAKTPDDARRLARDAGTSHARQAIAGWLAGHDPDALRRFFSLAELVRAGLEGSPLPAELAGWGQSSPPFAACLGTGLLPAWPWERYAGRGNTGSVIYAVPDLQLALAAGLAELDLPAILVPDLMSSAVLELLNTVPSRHPNDWQALVRQIGNLGTADVERYLGLLTTDGPLRLQDEGQTTR